MKLIRWLTGSAETWVNPEQNWERWRSAAGGCGMFSWGVRRSREPLLKNTVFICWLKVTHNPPNGTSYLFHCRPAPRTDPENKQLKLTSRAGGNVGADQETSERQTLNCVCVSPVSPVCSCVMVISTSWMNSPVRPVHHTCAPPLTEQPVVPHPSSSWSGTPPGRWCPPPLPCLVS